MPSDLIAINEGGDNPSKIMKVYPTKPVPYFQSTVAATTNSANITLGPVGEYELVVWHSTGTTATHPAGVTLQPSGGGSNLVFFPINVKSYFVRRFKSDTNAQVVQISNGFADEITAILQQVD